MFLLKKDVIESFWETVKMTKTSILNPAIVRSYKKTSDAYTVFRGINEAQKSYSDGSDTSIINLAEQKASQDKNTSGITVALEDFSESFKSFHGEDHSNISAKDAKAGLFGNKDNIFSSDEGQEILEDGNVFQSDLFEQERAKNGGIQYAQDNANLVESALAFAKADIEAIEKSADKAGRVRADGDLSYKDIITYTDLSGDSEYNDVTKSLDLDGNGKEISAEEYASYLLAADSIQQAEGSSTEVSFGQPDGIITSDEAYLVEKCDDEQLRAIAQQYYNRYFG